MRRELGGVYNIITDGNFIDGDTPDYIVLELRSMSGDYRYCVVSVLNEAITAQTNWFAFFSSELSLKEIKDCVLIPGQALIEKLKKEEKIKNGTDKI